MAISRPSKGKGIVILNKSDYQDKLLFPDSSKFQPINVNLANRFIKQVNLNFLTIKATINEATYSSLFETGPQPTFIIYAH